MLRTDYIYLKQYISEKIKDPNLTARATTLALGVCIGKLLKVSPTPLEAIAPFFDATYDAIACKAVSGFNENINGVDVQLAIAVSKSIWMMRQFAINVDTTEYIVPKGNGGFVDKFFGATTYLDPKVHEFLDKHNEVMIVLINRMMPMVSELVTAPDTQDRL